MGTLTGIGGAMVLTLYQGRRLFNWSTHVDFLHHVPPPHGDNFSSRLWGLTLALGTALSFSFWLIIQVNYPTTLLILQINK